MIRVEVKGDFACFSRPEFKAERVSYDIITPSAARGILEAVFWHPGMKFLINKIFVLSEIAFTNIKRNEVASKVSASNVQKVINGNNGPLYLATSLDIQQRASMLLKNVHYIIEAHFDMTEKANASDNPGKFQEMIKRRLRKGQNYYQPYLGCREFPAEVSLFEGDINSLSLAYANEERDLGFMLYDMDYSDKENITPMFFRAILKNGILDLTDCEVHR